MKQVKMSNTTQAEQLALGIHQTEGDGTNYVTIAVEFAGDEQGWLVYLADPERAREIGRTLLEGADIADGTVVPEATAYDEEAEAFHEHN